ncbi:Polyketide cyclase / dehydrase and lipid transport [Methanococcoides vulcani]|uniref:Polyketide cyclase / dehydrase and lipid transport n=1 Tax=Methanococcoides vulcani TaxID=1353158 RepID=A0A1I0BPR9_9EURY|nr:SRPBCC family protein [Methanococcoides vulcani]SET08941.1 Polyketide cyclase / dehydrase and lipid transport [Methanococcoides vulcani]
MLTLKDSITINRPPEVIFGWFSHFTENYTSWHQDHVVAKLIRGGNFEKGSILYAEEYLDGKVEKLSFEITKFTKGELIEYKLLFPHSIICPRGSFSIKPLNGEGSVFTATLSFRFGWLFSKIAKKRVDAIRTHMREEGENLKDLLENSSY